MDSKASPKPVLLIAAVAMCAAGGLISNDFGKPQVDTGDARWLDGIHTTDGFQSGIENRSLEVLKIRLGESADPLVRAAVHEIVWMDGMFLSIQRKRVRTVDGTNADVLLLHQPAFSVPGCDYSIIMLVTNGRVRDWKSCETYNRSGRHQITVEDIDGDGSLDVGFRYEDGMWGGDDPRVKRRPGDPRRWIGVYRVSSSQFISFFPESRRTVKVSPRTVVQDGVTLRFANPPNSAVQMTALPMTIRCENHSQKQVDLGRFELTTTGCASGLKCRLPSRRFLAPGHSVAIDILVRLTNSPDREVTITPSLDGNPKFIYADERRICQTFAALRSA